MIIALVSEWLDAGRGGAETSALQFIEQLLKHDIDLHVFTRSTPTAAGRMTVHTIAARGRSRAAASRDFMVKVEAAVKCQPFDIVHAITPCRRADIYQPRGGTVAESIQRNLALRSSGPTRLVKHLANFFNAKQRSDLAIEREMMCSGAVVAALSQYVVRQLKEHYQLPDERIRLVFNGIDSAPRSAAEREKSRVAMRKELGLSDEDLLVILIAHNFKLKGVATWMEALALLRSEGVTNVRSLVIGKGVTTAWQQKNRRLGLEHHLTFTGPTDRAGALRDAADVLVHPTYYDPCSRVVLEALADGLPCVASRWDGSAEMIEPGVSGLVIHDPGDAAALAEAVRKLLDPVLRAAMSEQAMKLGERISMARHGREMVALYTEVLARERQSGAILGRRDG